MRKKRLVKDSWRRLRTSGVAWRRNPRMWISKELCREYDWYIQRVYWLEIQVKFFRKNACNSSFYFLFYTGWPKNTRHISVEIP